jgi:threonine synthase
MDESKQILMYLITGGETYLPSNYPDVDLKRMKKKSELQRLRIAKREITKLIDNLKDGDA